jgi:hypothetical protein
LINELKKFDLIEIIFVLAKINLLVSEKKYAVSQPFQQYLYKYFLNDYHREKVLAFLRKEGDRFLLFHHHQLLFLLKNAFLNCGKLPNVNFMIPSVMKRFGKCCLLANDFLYLTGVEREELDEMDIEGKREVLWKESLPSFELNIQSEKMFDIGRVRYFFKRILPKLKDVQTFIDIDSKFQGFSGMSLDDYMFLVFGTLALYLIRKDEIIKNPNAIIIDSGDFTKHSEISAEKITKFLDLISIPVEQYKQEFLNSKDLDFNYGFLPFKKYPLARIYDGKYFCLDFNFLLDKISEGIFWLIHDSLKPIERNRFRTFWGNIFESYLIYFFEEAGLIKKDMFIPKPVFNNSQDEAADGILNFGEDLVLFEYKFTNLTQEAKYSSSRSDLINEIKLKFEINKNGEWKGYGQLANNIKKLFSKEGSIPCKYINKEKVKRVYPVLITYEHLFNAPLTNYFFNKYFQKLIDISLIEENIEIKPLIVFTVEDLEASQPYLSNFPGLIQDRLRFDEELISSFSDFLKIKHADDTLLIPEIIKKEYHSYGEEVTKAFFPDLEIKLPE